MNTPSAIVSQQCSCGRTGAHLHYSGSHDLLVKSGLVFLVLAEGISFMQGAVKGSTTLSLQNWEIQRYEIVMRKMAELTAPYEYLNWLVIAIELITLLLAVVTVATLHSIKNRSMHAVAIVGATALFVGGMITKVYYISATDAALTRLPSLVDPFVLETALEIEQRFLRAYGFWGSAAPDAINAIFSLAGLVFLVAALITSRHFEVWHPTPTPLAIALTQPEPLRVGGTAVQRSDREGFCESCGSRMPAQTASCPICGHRNIAAPPVPQPTPTKFCRYCGARIPRVSEYCEECGARLA